MKRDKNTGKEIDFYARGKQIFDRIPVLYKNSKRIEKNELHDMPILKHRLRKQPPGWKIIVSTDTT